MLYKVNTRDEFMKLADFAKDLFSDMDYSYNYEYLYPIKNEETGEYSFEFDVPGIKKEDLKVSMDDSKLYIVGEKKGSRGYKYNKKLTLPKNLDTSTCDVRLEDGILNISFKQKDSVEARQIEIK